MSRLADPHYDDIYSLSKDIKEHCLEGDDLDLESSLEPMLSHFRELQKLTGKLKINIDKYDSKTGTKANGYRSMIRVVATLVRHCSEILETVKHQQSTLGYVAKEVREDVETWISVLKGMIDILELTVEIKSYNEKLYPDTPDSQDPQVVNWAQKVLSFDLTPFYGSALGFHLRGDSRRMMHPLAISMASYSDIYGGSIFGKIKRLRESGYCWSYINDPKALSRKIVDSSRNFGVDFAQSFYNLPESDWVSKIKSVPPIRTSTLMKLYFEDLEIPRVTGVYEESFKVPIPNSYLKRKHVSVRLIANYRTKTMLGSCGCTTRLTCNCKFPEPKDAIIFHAHGGGFVSQTSKSHLDYLHQWSSQLDVPILSVDYSLAPEAAYPRAFEEVFYSYCWMLKNFDKLGTTGKRIIVAGDSAGGNLVASATLKTITSSIRKPDAVVLSYAALLIQFYPSPSRLLSLIDPLLMFGILLRCLNAYQDPNYLKTCPRTIEDELKMTKSNHDMYLSPLLTDLDVLKHFPKTVIIASDVDPCLDENVQFSSMLHEAGVDVRMEVVPGMPHSFLAFSQMSTECQLGVDHVTKKIGELIKVLNK